MRFPLAQDLDVELAVVALSTPNWIPPTSVGKNEGRG